MLPADMSRDAKRDTVDTPRGMLHPEPDVLTYALRDQLRYVERQLEAERQAHAEARRIIAGLVERIPALEPPSEERGSPQTVEEEPERTEPRHATGETQDGVQGPWWRRWLGG